MNLIQIISRVRFGRFIELIKLGFGQIWFVWPSYRATKSCMTISTNHFGRKHYRNGQANAFRHALWNILIAKHCSKMSKKIDKVLRWTKNITDWHEETFFSKELPMKMDYHNNQVGRMIFQTNPLFTEAQFVEILLNLTIDARQIQKESNLSDLKHQLVYITDDTKE